MRASFVGIVTLLVAASLSAQQQGYAPGDMQRVVFVDANQSVPMRDTVASRKGSWNVVVSKSSFVFKGPRATLRMKTALPEFQFELDSAFNDPVYLFRLDTHSDRREIRVARGTGLTPMSIPNDHIIETRMEEIASGQGSIKRYRLKPNAPLPSGEYCLSRRISICYDFGVD